MTQFPTNVADVFDRHRRRAMVALLLIGVMTALRAARQLVDDPISDYLGILMLVCVVGAMAIFASVFYWKLFKLPADQRPAVRLEKRSRGKSVTIIGGLDPVASDLEGICRQLKSRCATGGTVREGVIEVQGDHRAAATALLAELGYRP